MTLTGIMPEALAGQVFLWYMSLLYTPRSTLPAQVFHLSAGEMIFPHLISSQVLELTC